jgi:hypothetical protein
MFLEVLSSWSMEDCSIPKPMVPPPGEASSIETACFWKGYLTSRCRITVYQSRRYHLKMRPQPRRYPASWSALHWLVVICSISNPMVPPYGEASSTEVSVLGSAISLVDGDLRFTKVNGTISWRGLIHRDTMSLGVCSQRCHVVVPMLR